MCWNLAHIANAIKSSGTLRETSRVLTHHKMVLIVFRNVCSSAGVHVSWLLEVSF